MNQPAHTAELSEVNYNCGIVGLYFFLLILASFGGM